MFRSDKPDKIITMVTKTLQAVDRGRVRYPYPKNERKHLGFSFNRSFERQSVVIKMKIRHGPSVQTLYGTFDVAKETKLGLPREITVQLTGKEPTPSATVFVRIQGDVLKPARLPLENCLYKLKEATHWVQHVSRNHASDEVPEALFPLIEMASDHAKSFLTGLLKNAVSQKDKDHAKKLLAAQKDHIDNLLGYEPCLSKKDDF
jgi:hypothetical protein